MKRKTKVWVIGAVVALIVVVGSWFLSRALGLAGANAWVLRSGLSTLGLAAIGLVVWWFLKRIAIEEGDAPAPTGPDDIDVAVAAARSRLGASKLGGGSSLGNLPLLVVIGPDGSAKTTVIARSGLEPELLAGEIASGEAAAPTRAVNLWYAGGTVLVEAGGTIAGDATRWGRLVRHLHPRRLTAVFAAGQQAPRAALVCLSCEELLRAGSSETIPAAARTLRARLAELSERLGIRLPVYVLFTKADRVPYFAEYVHNFSREESQQVLGATLDVELDAPIGSYADRETARVNGAFTGIIRSLADKRLVVLSREHGAERRPGAYEFPRELRKVVPLATQFLVDLCKPSQLHSSPFLRGFYFTGVQAVIVTEAMPSAIPQAAARGSATIDATGVFSSRAGTAAPPRPAAVPTSRKVPRWVFLDRVFRDVILADRAAQGVTRGGAKVNILRRAALGTAAAVAAILAIAFTVSFASNRALQQRTVAAAGAVALIPASATDLPTADALERLDSLRARVALLRHQERDGAPLRQQWGLYRGNAILPAARAAYFANFDRLMFGSTRSAMADSLTALPESPRVTDDYGRTYDLLKAYLITTSHPGNSTAEFLPPVLMRSWLAGREIDSARTQLAERQMAFFAEELRVDNPFPAQPDPALVQRSRAFLTKFTGTERIYNSMITEAAKTNPPVNFNRSIAGSAAVLVDGYEVPGAFTKSGWAFMQTALGNVDRFFAGEPWVMGDQGVVSSVDRARVAQELRTRYVADYLRHWRTFLRSASVVRFGGLADAGRKLTVLSGNQSPILALLSTVANNTDVDSVAIRPLFHAVHQVTPPSVTNVLVVEKNQPYVVALQALTTAVEQAANAPAGQGDAALPAVATSALAARGTTRQMALGFQPDREGQVHVQVQSLIEAPINNVEILTRTVGTGELNRLGADFCGPFRLLMEKYPFSPGAPVEASWLEVGAIFGPTGSLRTFYERTLSRALVQQGNTYVPRENSQIQLSPQFIAFFNKAMAVSDALYKENPANPRMTLSLRPLLTGNIEWVTITIDGVTQRWTRTDAQNRSLTWNGPLATSASIAVRAGRQEGVLQSFNGTWSLFRLIHQIDGWGSTGGVYRPAWDVRFGGRQVMNDNVPVQLVVEMHLGATAPIMWDGYFSGLGCVTSVAR